jgi:SAM-dependent methyltransferase
MAGISREGMGKSFFEQAYGGIPPWDVGHPQGDIVRLYERGGFKGTVLDLGCGTGDNALFLAGKELEVWGVDAVTAAIEKARAKAARANVPVTVQVGDALDLKALGRTFDTVLDCGLFHVLSDPEREKYRQSVSAVVQNRGQLHILCFSDLEPGTEGPRRIRERELIELLNNRGWLVDSVDEARFETTLHPDGARAWLFTFLRTGT